MKTMDGYLKGEYKGFKYSYNVNTKKVCFYEEEIIPIHYTNTKKIKMTRMVFESEKDFMNYIDAKLRDENINKILEDEI